MFNSGIFLLIPIISPSTQYDANFAFNAVFRIYFLLNLEVKSIDIFVLCINGKIPVPSLKHVISLSQWQTRPYTSGIQFSNYQSSNNNLLQQTPADPPIENCARRDRGLPPRFHYKINDVRSSVCRVYS